MGRSLVTKLTLLWNPKTSPLLGQTGVVHENLKRRRNTLSVQSSLPKSYDDLFDHNDSWGRKRNESRSYKDAVLGMDRKEKEYHGRVVKLLYFKDTHKRR